MSFPIGSNLRNFARNHRFVCYIARRTMKETTPHKILLVDDDSLSLAAAKMLLEDNGYLVHTADSGSQAIEKFRKNAGKYALVIVDYQMKDMDGAATAQAILDISKDTYILIYSGDGSRAALQSTWKAGAVAFIEKGGDLDKFMSEVRCWCAKYDRTTRTLDSSAPTENEKFVASIGMIGRSRSLVEVARKVILYREKKQNVLILGETGTGKELVARGLHNPNDGDFYAINCAAYKGATELLEAELFGYEKGAFTGATQDKKGVLETANGGTVFFDEIHQLSLTAQAKLLRVFQEKRIRRVGGTKEYPVDFRLVAAAKPDLQARCDSGEFLLDLYHRLAVLTIDIPALKDRPEDIEPLLAHFCAKYSQTTGNERAFLMRTVDVLEKYPWPGNVRELEHTVYRILTDSPTDKISPEQLDAKFFGNEGMDAAAALTLAELRQQHEDQERMHIERMLKESKNKFQAAQRLGVSPSTLHSIMKRAGMYRTGEEA